MARRQHLLIYAAGFVAMMNPLVAQDSQKNESPAPAVKPAVKRAARGATPNSPEFDDVRRAIDALTPEQRRRFQENFARWSNLSPEEKRALRDQNEIRRRRVAQEVDRALQATGLQLEGERREQFAKRYAEERRKVEEQLRREMDEKRQPRLQEIVAKLKTEFSQETAPASPSASAFTVPTASNSPKPQ